MNTEKQQEVNGKSYVVIPIEYNNPRARRPFIPVGLFNVYGADPGVYGNLKNVVIYNGERPTEYSNSQNIIINVKDWINMRDELHPFVILVALLYGEESYRKTIFRMFSRVKIAESLLKFVKYIENDIFRGGIITGSDKSPLVTVALLLTYIYSDILMGDCVEDLGDVVERINDSTNNELRDYISDMKSLIVNL